MSRVTPHAALAGADGWALTVTLPLHYRYIAVALPLHYRYIDFTLPLHCRYITVAGADGGPLRV